MNLRQFTQWFSFGTHSYDGWLVRISVRLAKGDLDRLGNEAEHVRNALASRVAGASRPDDARTILAQDQYLMVIRSGRSPGNTKTPTTIVRRLLDDIAQPVPSTVGPIFPRLNAAFTRHPHHANDDNVRSALSAVLVDAERAGGGVVVELDLKRGSSRLFTLDTPEMEMISVLKRAIDAEQVVMHYQPIVRLSNGRIDAFEALMRVVDENGTGLLSPSRFIGVAERSGLIHELGRIALHKAADQMKKWRQYYGAAAPLRIAVNVASPQLANVDFAGEAEAAFADVGLAALALEVTESAQIQEMPQACATLDLLRSKGSWVALDDFGVEYSNLSYLRDLAVDAVKIDRSFLDDEAQSGRAKIILAKMVELTHLLDASVVAEGVLDAEHSEALHQLGVDYGQGGYFGLAMDVEDADACIAAQRLSGAPLGG